MKWLKGRKIDARSKVAGVDGINVQERCSSWAEQRTGASRNRVNDTTGQLQNGWVDSEAKAAANQSSAGIDWKITSERIGREKIRDDVWGRKVDLASGD